MFRNRNIFDTHGSSRVFWVVNENYVIVIHVYLEVFGFFWPFGFPPVLCLDKTCVSHLLSDPESRVYNALTFYIKLPAKYVIQLNK